MQSAEFTKWLDEYENKGKFKVFLPYSDLKEWIPKNGIYDDASNSFPLYRLADIRALSFLAYIGPTPGKQYMIGFDHTRFDHTLVVALTTEHILKQNEFPKKDINIGILAALLHDIAIPAYGDATKSVDPKNLNEEEFWWDVLDENAKKFINRHGVDKDRIDEIIKNRGTLGQVLDIADKITYVMKDLSAIFSYIFMLSEEEEPPYFLSDLQSILYEDPKIGNIYQDVSFDKDTQEVFFKNPERLKKFLLLRAILHQKLYINPISVGRDLFFANLLRPLYSVNSQGLLTPSKLRQMRDQDLARHLSEFYRPDFDEWMSAYFGLILWYPGYIQTQDEEEATRYAKELSVEYSIVGIKRIPGFDPATSYKVRDANGNNIPFRDFDEKGAAEIEAIERSTRGVFLFYTDTSSKIASLLQAAQSKLK